VKGTGSRMGKLWAEMRGKHVKGTILEDAGNKEKTGKRN